MVGVQAYSPLGSPGSWVKGEILKDPTLVEIAEKLNKSPAQVALRWGIQSGHSVLPKSVNEFRIKENFNLFDWCIPPELFSKLSSIHQVSKLNAPYTSTCIRAIQDRSSWAANELEPSGCSSLAKRFNDLQNGVQDLYLVTTRTDLEWDSNELSTIEWIVWFLKSLRVSKIRSSLTCLSFQVDLKQAFKQLNKSWVRLALTALVVFPKNSIDQFYALLAARCGVNLTPSCGCECIWKMG